MAITSGFGVFFDFKNGSIRHWFMGCDGIKRWADNNEPVNKSAALPNDIARCPGIGNDKDGWHRECNDCLRRTAPVTHWATQMSPPDTLPLQCEFRISRHD